MFPAHVRTMVEETNEALTANSLYPIPQIVSGATTTPTITVAGREVIQFCTGNSLGIATDSNVCKAVRDGLKRYGMTASGSRLVCGTQDIHVALEEELADFQETDDALVFFLVTVASSGILNGLCHPQWHQAVSALNPSIDSCGDTELFVDQYTHPTAFDAASLAGGRDKITVYRHCDMNALERKLKRSVANTKIIVTDGLFSAQGDLAPLPDIVQLADRFEAITFVDDSHGSFVLGEHGRGTWELQGVEGKIDFKVGSLAKALAGGLGAFLAADASVVDFMRINARHAMFGGSIPPAIAKGILRAIEIVRSEPWRREKLMENANYLRSRLNAAGYNTLGSVAHILPILIGDEATAIAVERELLERGIFTPCFRYPACPKGKAIIRVNPTVLHTQEHLDYFLTSFFEITSHHAIAA